MDKSLYDLIVIGGGITGCEAAWTAASRGCRTLLCNITLDQVNLPPHISALFIAEKDIERVLTDLGGGIFLQALRRSLLGVFSEPNEPNAVISLDKREFSLVSKELLENHPMIDLRQALIGAAHIGDNIESTSIFGEIFTAKKALFAPGTYVGGRIRVGKSVFSAGRYGDLSSDELKKVFEDQGFKLVEWEGKTPQVVDMRRVNMEGWRELPPAGAAIQDIILGRKDIPQVRMKAFWRENQGNICYLFPLSSKTREAQLHQKDGGRAPSGVMDEKAVVRDSVEHSCLIVGSAAPNPLKGLAFAGKFAGKNGYIECALDGRDKALKLMGEG